MTTQSDLAVLAPLARVIANTVQETPVNLGSPEGATDLIQQLILRTAAYVGSELPTTPGLARHMVDLDQERQRQLAKFGEQYHPDGTSLTEDRERANSARHICQSMARMGQLTWRDILHEEVQEAFAEKDPALLRAELVQVSAVCAAWIADLDNRPTP